MKQFALNIPLHSLSFGVVGNALCREVYKRNISPPIAVIGNPDLSAWTPPDNDYNLWLQSGINKFHKNHNRNNPAVKLWHVSGLMESFSKEQIALTFHELDTLTSQEVNICNQQKVVFVTSRYSEEVFKEHGVNNVKYLELGFDSEIFKRLDKRLTSTDKITFLITGKLEPLRKRHCKTLALLMKKVGNNQKFAVNLATYNPFMKVEDQQAILSQALNGVRYWNLNLIPFVKTHAEYNQILNACDVIVSMSGGEAFCIPTFSAVSMGKHCVAHNCSAYKDYLTPENAVLVEPSSKIKAVDGIFFHGDQSQFNVGNLFDYDENDFMDALDVVIKRVEANPVNSKGLELQNRTYKQTVDTILSVL